MLTSFILKTTYACDLRCDYCYVTGPAAVVKHERTRMPTAALDRLFETIGTYLEAHDPETRLTLYWHGGEPLLLGREFYDEALRQQARHLPPGVEVANCLQTHGGLLDEDWARFLHDNEFSVTVSMDGPPEVHDRHRRRADGEGSFAGTLRALERLDAVGHPLGVLAVLTPEAVADPVRQYAFFRSLGVTWMDFLLPYALEGTEIYRNTSVADLTRFWTGLFDVWMAEAQPDVTVRYLKDLTSRLLGGQGRFCVAHDMCGSIATVDHALDVFACDDLMHLFPDTKLGNLYSDDLEAVAAHDLLARLQPRSGLMGPDCLGCDVYSICLGGCPGKRPNPLAGHREPSFYCAMYYGLITHVRARLAEQFGGLLGAA